MSLTHTPRPLWLTFDCYGTLIQWDEGLLAHVHALLEAKGQSGIDPDEFIRIYDHHEHRLEQEPPHRSFKEVSRQSLRLALEDLDLGYQDSDSEQLNARISAMPPFPEVVSTLGWLEAQGFRIAIVSNTDDDIIAGNVAQLNGHIDRVITAQQAGAYKPDLQLFRHAHQQLGVSKKEVLHICASPHLDHAAARDMGFRCVWIDRGTRRRLLADYTPDAILPDLAGLEALFTSLEWV
ncbi:HAD family hydrolase [Pseudomonas gingeri]|uniref:HAD family hydrolase n=1 Tax=Pseudomonas gingeri TaxID=117681 RepID=UPI0015A385BF|nr:HAD family hydrolase [Pseudomonas gingeri]NWE30424.1 HAD hydrolase-like protein [Pseudomonas gingeri]NWE96142.1 HAD hydrolase-like protein [Pseudomonas gingeri]